MNKVKYRNEIFIQRKRKLIVKILNLTNQSPASSVAKSLRKKSGNELVNIYRREKTARGIPSSFK
jgi:hypothetical protein